LITTSKSDLYFTIITNETDQGDFEAWIEIGGVSIWRTPNMSQSRQNAYNLAFDRLHEQLYFLLK
jgi:hypothetical protein